MSEQVNMNTMHDRNMQSIRATQRVTRALVLLGTYLFLFAMALIIVFPFYWMIISSLKDMHEYKEAIPTFWPRAMLFSNYATAFTTGR